MKAGTAKSSFSSFLTCYLIWNLFTLFIFLDSTSKNGFLFVLETSTIRFRPHLDHLGEQTAVTHEPVRTVLNEAIFKRSRDANAPKLKKRILGSILKIGSPMNNSVDFDIDDTCYQIS
ncbi:hypothetical protein B9Z55_027376 [Caenorhabditis nigoni]|uniref:Uncharacterized protein n=1 Tax=Caenorhabditis nigoni TaxID=1611254 RepID=A0A2G5SG83_9PELO|nr:hypothetical protein B9Z55_027376 [Caenorhabditis nigoni]